MTLHFPRIVPMAAATLLVACGAEVPNAPPDDGASLVVPQEATSARAALPPVTGEPAFTRTTDDPRVEWGPCFEWMPEGCELAVVQAVDPAGRNADAFFKLPPGSTVVEHWHTSAERMVLLSGVMEVEYEGQDPVRLSPGTYAYGPAGLPHQTHCLPEGGESCILFIAFEDPIDAIDVRGGDLPQRP